MIEMPPLRSLRSNGIRMGYYEAGRSPTASFFAMAGRKSLFLASPDQGLGRGRHPGNRADQRLWYDRPAGAGRAHDMEHLTGDLVGLLDHLKIDRRSSSATTQGGFIVTNAAAPHRSRRRRDRRQHARPRPPAGRSGRAVPEAVRRQMYIVQFQDPPRARQDLRRPRQTTFDAFTQAVAAQGRPRRRRCGGCRHRPTTWPFRR